MRKWIVQSLPILVLIGVAAPRAQAEPIRLVTGGQTVAQMNGGSFNLTGDGFSLAGAAEGFVSTTFECTPCAPSDRITLSLSSFTSGHFLDGLPGEFAGVTYPATYLFGTFTFTSSDFNSGVMSPTRTAPFTFRGELFNYASPSEGELGGTPLFFAELAGSGTATAHFAGPVEGLWFAQDITYQFTAPPSPTPEPASLLLCGSAVAWLVGRRGCRRRLAAGSQE
jgi:hypothetical protein